MLNRLLFTLTIFAASPAILFSQDIFVTFDQGPTFSPNQVVSSNAIGTSASAFVYIDGSGPNYGALDIEFEIDDPSVIQFTDFPIFNEEIINQFNPDPTSASFGFRFDRSLDDPPVDETFAGLDEIDIFDAQGNVIGTSTSQTKGQLFGTSIRGTSQGLNPAFGIFDSNFFDNVINPQTGVPGGAFLFAQLDFDILSTGTVNFALSPNPGADGSTDAAFVDLTFDVSLFPTFGGGTFQVVPVPEPGSATLLALGLVGFVTRRRRRA